MVWALKDTQVDPRSGALVVKGHPETNIATSPVQFHATFTSAMPISELEKLVKLRLRSPTGDDASLPVTGVLRLSRPGSSATGHVVKLLVRPSIHRRSFHLPELACLLP